jgi:16S rRNA (guanine527-N7)-methyltransferase
LNAASLRQLLDTGLAQFDGLEATARQTGMLLRYIELLERWNRTYNLTAVRSLLEMVPRHVLDSLSVLPWVGDGRLLDAGTGAGLPGIPLAIMRPDLSVTLLDSAGKKIRFIRHVTRELELTNVEPVQSRLESFTEPRGFDAIISRAFTSLAGFAIAARHLCNGETRLLAMKGRCPEDELADLPEWLNVEAIEKLSVPGLKENRHLVIMSVIA